ANGRREFLELEPCAGLVGAYLKRNALAEEVDGQFEIFERGRAERQRLLGLRCALRIDKSGERQVPCPFDKHRKVAEKFAVRAELKRLLDGALGEKVCGGVAGGGGPCVG